MFKPETEYQKILRIIDRLSIKEQQYLHPNSSVYKDSPNSIYKYIYEKNNYPIAFIDVYPNNMKSKTEAFIIVAVDPKYRRQGIVNILIEKASYYLKNLGYKQLIWRCETNNINSRKSAVKNGFKLITENIDQCVYEKRI